MLDHQKDDSAVKKEDMYNNGGGSRSKQSHETTKGYRLSVQWKGRTTTWEPLKDLKEADPVKLADYTIASEIDAEPSFAW
eukprot:13403854-Ditylum_brightwellii.AAC.1